MPLLTTALENFLRQEEQLRIEKKNEQAAKRKRERSPTASPEPVMKRKKRGRGRPRKIVYDDDDDDDDDDDEKKKKKQPRTKKQAKIIRRSCYFFDKDEDEEEEEDERRRARRSESKTKKPKEQLPPIDMSKVFQARPLKVGPNGEVVPKSVARFGRIYKRKPPDRVREKNCGQLKTAPGMRLCRICKKLLPLEKFYSYGQRFVCKYHHYQMVLEKRLIKFRECPYEELAWHAWKGMHHLCPVLGYAHVNYDRHDMMDLMKKTDIPPFCKPMVVPIDPTKPLRPRNLAIVTLSNLKLLARLWTQSLSAAQFILFVQSVNLLPDNADVGVPWDPFHDPNYKRVDIDVIPILEKEKTELREKPLRDAVEYAKTEWKKKKTHVCLDEKGASHGENTSTEEKERQSTKGCSPKKEAFKTKLLRLMDQKKDQREAAVSILSSNSKKTNKENDDDDDDSKHKKKNQDDRGGVSHRKKEAYKNQLLRSYQEKISNSISEKMKINRTRIIPVTKIIPVTTAESTTMTTMTTTTTATIASSNNLEEEKVDDEKKAKQLKTLKFF